MTRMFSDESIEVMPGERYRVTYEGVVVLREGRPVIVTDRGAQLAIFTGAKIEEISLAARRVTMAERRDIRCRHCGEVDP